MTRYSEIIADLERSLTDLRQKGITVEALEKSVEKLKTRSKNVSTLEENLDAVRSEIVEPVQAELDRGVKLSKLSYFVGLVGTVVGAAGLSLSAYTILNSGVVPSFPTNVSVSESSETEIVDDGAGVVIHDSIIDESLDEMRADIRLLKDFLVPKSELFLQEKQVSIESANPLCFSSEKGLTFCLEFYDSSTEQSNGLLGTILSVSINGSTLGAKAFEDGVIQLENDQTLSGHTLPWKLERATDYGLFVFEGETIVIHGNRFQIDEILTKRPVGRASGDSDSLVIVSVNPDRS